MSAILWYKKSVSEQADSTSFLVFFQVKQNDSADCHVLAKSHKVAQRRKYTWKKKLDFHSSATYSASFYWKNKVYHFTA